MRSPAAHHPLTYAQLVPHQQCEPPSQLPLVYTLSMTPYGMDNPFGQFWVSSPGYVLSQLLVHFQAEKSLI